MNLIESKGIAITVAVIMGTVYATSIAVFVFGMKLPVEGTVRTVVSGVRGVVLEGRYVALAIAGTLAALGTALAAIFNYLTKTYKPKELPVDKADSDSVCPFHPNVEDRMCSMEDRLGRMEETCVERHGRLDDKVDKLKESMSASRKDIKNLGALVFYTANQIKELFKHQGLPCADPPKLNFNEDDR